MTLLKEQTEVSNQRGIPANEKNSSSTITTITGETVQLFYWNSSGVRTQDAGQVAGTVVEGVLAKNNLLNKAGTMEATSKDTSLSFTAGALTTEKPLLITDIEYLDSLSGKDRANAITANLANGEYVVDYAKGIIYGKKTTTATTLTSATYKYPVLNISLSSGDIQIGAVELKNASTDDRAAIVRADAAKTAATMVLVTQNIDSSGNIGGGSSPSTTADYKSPADFTATYTSNVTITLRGVPITITDNSQIKYIMMVPAAGQAKIFVNGSGGVTIAHAANVLTISGAGTPFTAGDVYEVGINGTTKAYDLSTDAKKTINLTPESSKYVQDSLVDTTNVAADTNYYPSSTGMSMDGYKDFSLSGKFIDADGTMTLSLQATNDEDTTNAEWIDISLLGIDGNTGINVIASAMTVTNGTLTFGIEYNNLNYSNIRVKMVNGGATNTAIIKARRKAL